MQMCKLGKGTISHGAKVTFDNIFYGLSYFLQPYVFSVFANVKEGKKMSYSELETGLTYVAIFQGTYSILGLI